jgi:hypothetical protein
MNERSIQRRVFIKGLVSTGGAMLAGCSSTQPPTYGNLLRMGDLLTYNAHRLLLPGQSLVREYDYSDISSIRVFLDSIPSSERPTHVCSATISPAGDYRWKGAWRDQATFPWTT